MEKIPGKPPIKIFQSKFVKAAIWVDSKIINDTLTEVHSIKIDRSYKDKNSNEWKHTSSFFIEDLPKVALVATEAYKFLRMNTFEPETRQNGNNDVIDSDQVDDLEEG